MTKIYYDDDEPRTPYTGPPISSMDPVKKWSVHFHHLCELSWISQHPDSGPMERRQANREIEICRRKLAFWERQHGWDAAAAAEEAARARAIWQSATGGRAR